jgi:broad specificity phosphatase PhoE
VVSLHSKPTGAALARLIAVVFSGFCLLLSSSLHSAPVVNTDANAQASIKDSTHELVIFLVRHAEKQSGDNPSLTPQGQSRASTLAQILKDNPLDGIYSTNYKRTHETATPTASKQALSVTLYNPSKLSEFSQQLLSSKGRYLVVGHSNTTTELVTLLGGQPHGAIDDKSEFNRLYILTVTLDEKGQKQRVNTVLLRYGLTL